MSEEEEIAAWLRAQAEADVKAAGVATDGPWEPRDMQVWGAARAYGGGRPGEVLVIKHTWPQEAGHIVRHDPLTEKARAESVLEVIREYEAAVADVDAANRPAERKWASPHLTARQRALALVIDLLAYGYRHRAGWKAEWKP